MKFSKIGALLLTLACLLLPFSSASAAGAGVWDNIGTYGMTSQTPIIKSGGGKFYFHNNSFYGFTFTLYEVDGAGSTPEIARKNIYAGPKSNSPVIDVSDFTDGANKKAELVLFKGNDTYITVTCYD